MERETETQTERVFSPNVHSSHGRTRLKSEAKSDIQVSHGGRQGLQCQSHALLLSRSGPSAWIKRDHRCVCTDTAPRAQGTPWRGWNVTSQGGLLSDGLLLWFCCFVLRGLRPLSRRSQAAPAQMEIRRGGCPLASKRSISFLSDASRVWRLRT